MRSGIGLTVSFFLGCALASCTSPGGAPRSADAPIPATSEGLYQLFVAECVEQRNLAWVREESARLRSSRCSFLQGPGGEGDCRQRNDGMVSWRAPTAAGSEVVVTMLWPVGETPSDPYGPPGDRRLDCSVATPEALGAEMQQVAFSFAQSTGLEGPRERSEPGYQHWVWSPPSIHPTQQLILIHIDANERDKKWDLLYQFGRYPE